MGDLQISHQIEEAELQIKLAKALLRKKGKTDWFEVSHKLDAAGVEIGGAQRRAWDLGVRS